MVSLADLQSSIESLSLNEQFELLRTLSARLAVAAATPLPKDRPHSVLDIPLIDPGDLLPSQDGAEDLLSEMLEGRS